MKLSYLMLTGLLLTVNAFAGVEKQISCGIQDIKFTLQIGEKIITGTRNAGMTKTFKTVSFKSNALNGKGNAQISEDKKVSFNISGTQGLLDNSQEECNSGEHYTADLTLTKDGVEEAHTLDCFCYRYGL